MRYLGNRRWLFRRRIDEESEHVVSCPVGLGKGGRDLFSFLAESPTRPQQIYVLDNSLCELSCVLPESDTCTSYRGLISEIITVDVDGFHSFDIRFSFSRESANQSDRPVILEIGQGPSDLPYGASYSSAWIQLGGAIAYLGLADSLVSLYSSELEIEKLKEGLAARMIREGASTLRSKGLASRLGLLARGLEATPAAQALVDAPELFDACVLGDGIYDLRSFYTSRGVAVDAHAASVLRSSSPYFNVGYSRNFPPILISKDAGSFRSEKETQSLKFAVRLQAAALEGATVILKRALRDVDSIREEMSFFMNTLELRMVNH